MYATLGGLRVIENDNLPVAKPVIEVREHVPMTDEGRAKANKYLLYMFGERPFILRDADSLIMHPVNVARLRDVHAKDAPLFDPRGML